MNSELPAGPRDDKQGDVPVADPAAGPETPDDASALPAGSAKDLRRLETFTRLMDDAVRIPVLGIRVGLDPILGLLPGAGDVLGATLSGWIVVTAARMGATPSTLLRMIANLLLDGLLGAVPLVGDLFDVGFKANRRNRKLLRAQEDDPQGLRRRSRWLVLGTVAGTVVVVLLVLVGLAMFLAWAAARVLGMIAG